MATLDQLRDKWDSITPRERKLVILLGVSFVVTIILWLGLTISDRLAAMEQSNAKMRKALGVLADYRVRGRPDAAGAGAGAAVEIPAEPVKLESYLDKAAQKVGITVPSYRPRGSTTRNGFATHVVELSVNGLTIDQVKDFLESIEKDNKLVAVTRLEIQANRQDKEKLNLELEVSTYSRIAQAPAAGAGGGTGATGAGTGATGTGAPGGTR